MSVMSEQSVIVIHHRLDSSPDWVKQLPCPKANTNGLNLTLLVAGHNVPDLLVGPGAQDLYQHTFLRPRTLHRNRSDTTMRVHGTQDCGKTLHIIIHLHKEVHQRQFQGWSLSTRFPLSPRPAQEEVGHCNVCTWNIWLWQNLSHNYNPKQYLHYHNETVVLWLWKRGLPQKFTHVLNCPVKLMFFLTVYAFGSCFTLLSVILVSDYFNFIIFILFLFLTHRHKMVHHG